MADPVTLSSSTTTGLPDWYTNTAMEALANAKALAARPYTAFTGPRVAGFTPEQLRGFAATETAAGAYQPGLAKATEVAGGALATSPLATAQPYLSKSAESTVAGIGAYMNPYTEQVVNRIGELGARTLREQLMPAIGAKFIGAGQFGGSRQAEAIGRALRDVSESTLAEQAKALQAGYSEAAGLSAADLARMGTLASVAGSMGERTGAQGLDVSRQLGALAEQAQELGLRGAEAVTGVGAEKRKMDQANIDVAVADYLRQLGYPAEQINTMIGALQGISGAVPKVVEEVGQQIPNEYPSELANLSKIATGVGIAKDLGIVDSLKDQITEWFKD